MTTITIVKDANLEYRVPGPDGTEAQAYYTDDRDDAIGTAYRTFNDKDLTIKFRTVAWYHGERI